MLVRVLDGSQCIPCDTEFFSKNNLDSGLLVRYAYGKTLYDGAKGRLLMTIYDDEFRSEDIGVVEWFDRIYLIPMDALEEVEV